MKPTIVPLVAAVLLSGAASAQIVATPRATLLPATATSHPFLAARQALQPVDLASRGYTEEEFLLSGQANRYEWDAPGAGMQPLRVLTANVAYTTRFLLRRPVEAKQFSGSVIVELLDPGSGYERAPLWGLAYEHFLRSGDIYIGLSVQPAGLQVFDAQRYAKLAFPAAAQPGSCAGGDAPVRDAPVWDAIAQLGALLRSSSKDNPLGRYAVQRLLAGGYARAGGYLVTYINALHGRLRLGDDSPVYDGYLQVAGALDPAPLNSCAAALAAEDPRRRLGPHDVPVMYVNTQSEAASAAALRRPDSDAAQDRFRQYELPGVAREGPFPAGQPGDADLQQSGAQRLAAGERCAAPATELDASASYHAVWSWGGRRARQPEAPGAAPPASRLLDLDAQGMPRLDAQGNALGGLRLPFLDVPLARYAVDSPASSADQPQQACRMSGSMRRFEAPTLRSLYRSRLEYQRRFNLAVDDGVKAQALLPADAAGLKAQAAREAPAF
jgi:hypothetical protein